MSDNKSLIINSPYEMPTKHWLFKESGKHEIADGRRDAGYTIANPNISPTSKKHNDFGLFVKIELVNKIRCRVDKWRDENYPGVTSITKKLLEHWNDENQRSYQFFFCQIEAIETLIWLIETDEAERVGINIVGDSSQFPRLCSKLATGTGKTIVMAMLIAWQALNKSTYPRDNRFSKNFFIVAPNLTVKDRLSVLLPSNLNNYYKEFGVVESGKMQMLNQANVKILNWHQLSIENEEKIKKRKGVDKRGVKSNKAYIKDALGDMAHAKDIIVINDEAHHAWRVPPDQKLPGVNKDEKEQATQWIGGLDRIYRTIGIAHCFDFSATPFMPSGNDIKLFDWIVSDFGLNDAIESGLVKIPQICRGDNANPDTRTYDSRLKHIYYDPEVKDDLNRKKVSESTPLPDLVKNAYELLGNDWEETKKRWDEMDQRTTPPVMITVANTTETAARIKHSFDNNKFTTCKKLSDPKGILHIDSKVLKEGDNEQSDSIYDSNNLIKQTKKQKEELLRKKANTVGRIGEPGENIQNVISVGMLSEGWDARTVTHIMGLRAFTSQLLCEQTIGRGLRRSSYDADENNRFVPEYVKVFGIPFRMLPHEDTNEERNPVPTIAIHPEPEKSHHEITWPNLIRIQRNYSQYLSVDWDKVEPLQLDATKTPSIVDLAPVIDGKLDITTLTTIDLEQLLKGKRLQTILFELATNTYRQKKPNWQGSQSQLIADLVRLCFEYIDLWKLEVIPESYNKDMHKRKVIIALNDTKILTHFWHAIHFNNENKPTLVPVIDTANPISSTKNMPFWRTSKPCSLTDKSHINYCVFDGTWEKTSAYELDRSKLVTSWVKNDHLNFSIEYSYEGIIRKYYPDFIIKLSSGKMLILEVKGQENQQTEAKHLYMQDWVTAVNNTYEQKWDFQVLTKTGQIQDILKKANKDI